MSCFTDLIAVRGLCDPVTPSSGFYTDAVGLSLRDMEAFMTADFTTVRQYFDSRLEYAIAETSQQVHSFFQNKYKAISLVDSHRLGIHNASLTSITGGDYRGINMEFSQSDSYFQFYVSELSLYLYHTGTVNILVYDLYQDKLIDTIPVEAVSGKIVTVYPHKFYRSEMQPMNLFFGYDSDGINSSKTSIKSGLCCGKIACNNSYMTAKGAVVSGAFVKDNVEGISDTAGLSLVYSLSCDHKSWLCSHAGELVLPIIHKLAEVMVSDALLNSGGERATNSHTINVDVLEKRYNFYRSNYTELMNGVMANMLLPRSRCFQCNTPTRHKITLP